MKHVAAVMLGASCLFVASMARVVVLRRRARPH
jgi:hypothetical protein